MIVEIPDDNSIIKWKMNDDDDEWKSAEILDLINAYVGIKGEWIYRQEWFEDEEKPRMTWGCNLCGHSIKSVHEKQNFCPNCGAQLRS